MIATTPPTHGWHTPHATANRLVTHLDALLVHPERYGFDGAPRRRRVAMARTDAVRRLLEEETVLSEADRAHFGRRLALLEAR